MILEDLFILFVKFHTIKYRQEHLYFLSEPVAGAVERVSLFLFVVLDKLAHHFFQAGSSRALVLLISSFSLILELRMKVAGCQKNHWLRILYLLPWC